MALPRQKFREVVLYLLFSMDFSSDIEESENSLVMEQLKVSKTSIKEAQSYAQKIFDQLANLDQTIADSTTDYEVTRICRVEKNILRMGVFEMLVLKDTPGKVVIAESIRLTRKFSSPESGNFVNAILDAIYKKNIPMLVSV